MKRMRWLLVAIVALGAIFVAGCGGSIEPARKSGDLYIRTIVVDGEAITCVVYADSDYDQGGLSCDWSDNG